MVENSVSIIIPVFNGERFIERTLESALNQTYRPIEIVVVDDGSTDQTSAIVEAAAARHSSIRLFRGARLGAGGARNLGIRQAYGNLIAPLDADDLWHPEKISRQVAIIRESSSRVGLVYCWSLDIDENDFIIPPIKDKSTVQGNVVIKLIEENNFLTNGSVPLIRRSYLEAVGGYDDSKPMQGSEDWKLYLALAEICEFAVIPAHLVGYRRSDTNISKDTKVMEHSIELVERWITDKWPSLPKSVTQQMFYNSNCYLAHQSLTTNNLRKAIRYEIKGLRAKPSALFSKQSIVFFIRVLVRLLGIRRFAMRLRARSMKFSEFMPNVTYTRTQNL
jgi:glycosyltransferase involved in cell wall biosynthesis